MLACQALIQEYLDKHPLQFKAGGKQEVSIKPEDCETLAHNLPEAMAKHLKKFGLVVTLFGENYKPTVGGDEFCERIDRLIDAARDMIDKQGGLSDKEKSNQKIKINLLKDETQIYISKNFGPEKFKDASVADVKKLCAEFAQYIKGPFYAELLPLIDEKKDRKDILERLRRAEIESLTKKGRPVYLNIAANGAFSMEMPLGINEDGEAYTQQSYLRWNYLLSNYVMHFSGHIDPVTHTVRISDETARNANYVPIGFENPMLRLAGAKVLLQQQLETQAHLMLSENPALPTDDREPIPLNFHQLSYLSIPTRHINIFDLDQRQFQQTQETYTAFNLLQMDEPFTVTADGHSYLFQPHLHYFAQGVNAVRHDAMSDPLKNWIQARYLNQLFAKLGDKFTEFPSTKNAAAQDLIQAFQAIFTPKEDVKLKTLKDAVTRSWKNVQKQMDAMNKLIQPVEQLIRLQKLCAKEDLTLEDKQLYSDIMNALRENLNSYSDFHSIRKPPENAATKAQHIEKLQVLINEYTEEHKAQYDNCNAAIESALKNHHAHETALLNYYRLNWTKQQHHINTRLSEINTALRKIQAIQQAIPKIARSLEQLDDAEPSQYKALFALIKREAKRIGLVLPPSMQQSEPWLEKSQKDNILQALENILRISLAGLIPEASLNEIFAKSQMSLYEKMLEIQKIPEFQQIKDLQAAAQHTQNLFWLYHTGNYSDKTYNYEFHSNIHHLVQSLKGRVSKNCNDAEDRTGRGVLTDTAHVLFRDEFGHAADIQDNKQLQALKRLQARAQTTDAGINNTRANGSVGMEVHAGDGNDHLHGQGAANAALTKGVFKGELPAQHSWKKEPAQTLKKCLFAIGLVIKNSLSRLWEKFGGWRLKTMPVLNASAEQSSVSASGSTHGAPSPVESASEELDSTLGSAVEIGSGSIPALDLPEEQNPVSASGSTDEASSSVGIATKSRPTRKYPFVAAGTMAIGLTVAAMSLTDLSNPTETTQSNGTTSSIEVTTSTPEKPPAPKNPKKDGDSVAIPSKSDSNKKRRSGLSFFTPLLPREGQTGSDPNSPDSGASPSNMKEHDDPPPGATSLQL